MEKKIPLVIRRGSSPMLCVLPEGSHDRRKGEVCWRTIAEMQLSLQYALKK